MIASLRNSSQFALLFAALSMASCAQAQDDEVNLDLFGQGDGQPTVSFKLEPAKGKAEDLKPGDEVVFTANVIVPFDAYTYSMKSPGGTPSTIAYKTGGLEEISEGFQCSLKPKKSFDSDLEKDVEKISEPVTWTKRFKLKEGAKPSDVWMAGEYKGQVCTKQLCKSVSDKFSLRIVKGAPSKSTQSVPHAAVTMALKNATDAKPGDKVQLSIEVVIDEGWHTYSTTQSFGAEKTQIEVGDTNGLKPLGELTANKEFHVEKIDEDIALETYEGTVAWTQDFEVLPETDAKDITLNGSIRFQLCDASRCLAAKKIEFVLGSFPEVAPAIEVSASDPAQSPTETDSATDKLKAAGLIPFLLTAAGAGFLALLTPCVFPMVPITVNFFLKQSEKEHHRPVTLALVYCAGIVLTFTALGLLMAAIFGATSVNQLANNLYLNLFLACVIAVFGISMLGAFEITVPSFLLTWSSRKESGGGILGTLFMALTFTLVSFTCTFAFAGLILVMATKGEALWPILGMMAFSTAFALPFFLLALFPAFLQKLPKTGGWMNTVKVTMGVIEIGAAVKFLSIAELSVFAPPILVTFHVMLGIWLICALFAGLYILGLVKKPGSPRVPLTATRALCAAPFLVLSWMLISLMMHPTQPANFFEKQIAAIAPPAAGATDPDFLDLRLAREYAQANNLPLFLDFTGVNCPNCRKMEQQMLYPENKRKLKRYVKVALYLDNILLSDKHPPKQENIRRYDEDESLRTEVLNLNRKYQEQWFQDVSMPSYAVVDPRDDLANMKILTKLVGYHADESKFADFLENGLKQWDERQDETGSQASKKVAANPAASMR